ncbi:MAG: malto-oligosyltrehalose trehalohydrolase [Acidobacteria bacterium RIFCSPLOWO2_12_FULL_65_11]|nr:MAG: malto-oligosyltrehalose trehalohydrolase [Acidobacteria bacterium RIFCSPLOWO2_02_FULL_64_15]OFW29253.1 MAG: malto-oligosyltrehalose trehalohydrolase [Acidobacteria bacterium RIFCSPLOWO2_12_FULL_65_11]
MTAPIPGTWTPSLGAHVASEGTTFRVWAPSSTDVDVIVERPGGPLAYALAPSPDGAFSAVLPGVRAGDRYRYRLDGDRLLPDPASRFQPDGVHGPSQVVDPRSFRWTDDRWTGLALDDIVFYELHVGTFSPEGTFAGVTSRLAQLATLGVTAIELMPVADFPGARNWGYDGVALFAPARCYGTPDDLRRLVDTAHGLGLGVFLDVVYNHLGPDGAYHSAFSPYYFTDRHQTPWGAGVNYDGDQSAAVREFVIENALHWVHEYHVDGLRLDATHAIADEGPRHVLAELAARVRESATGRRVLVVAEDHRNLDGMLRPEREGGWGLDAVWADDFHHQCRRLLAGDSEGYYRDYSGRTADLATTIRRGWFFAGEFSIHLGRSRGTDPTGLPPNRFVICLQNHDQIGNRALGERLHQQIDPAAYRAASVLLLMAPETPLLFMGQEWAASTPFLYFSDHHHELGRLVTAGRREEFRHFAAFSDPNAREQIPDPQAPSTFLSSRLIWDERHREPHAATARLYQALLTLRRHEPTLHGASTFHVASLNDATIAIRRDGSDSTFLIVVCLTGAGVVDFPVEPVERLGGRAGRTEALTGPWQQVLTTEDPAFSPDPAPLKIDGTPLAVRIRFARPSAIILKRELEGRRR